MVFQAYYVSLSRFVMLVVVVLELVYGIGVCLAGKPLPLVSQELRSCLYSSSTSKMSDVCSPVSQPCRQFGAL
jgi:hypothetical protein